MRHAIAAECIRSVGRAGCRAPTCMSENGESRSDAARIMHVHAPRFRQLLPRARDARRALRRPLFRRRVARRASIAGRSARCGCRGARTAASSRAPRRPRSTAIGRACAAARSSRPATPASTRSARLAQAAVDLIEDGVLEDGGIEALAARVGVTSRHLRRIFDAEFGVSPIEYAQTQRLLLAKRLLTDTALPVTDVALASGFAQRAPLQRAVPARATGWRRRGCARMRAPATLPTTLSLRARVPAAVRLGRDARLPARARRSTGVETRRRAALSRARSRSSIAATAARRLHRASRSRRAAKRAARRACRRRSRASCRRCSSRVRHAFDLACDPRRSPRALGRAWRRRIRACASRARSTASSSRCARSSASRSACARRARCSVASCSAFGEPRGGGRCRRTYARFPSARDACAAHAADGAASDRPDDGARAHADRRSRSAVADGSDRARPGATSTRRCRSSTRCRGSARGRELHRDARARLARCVPRQRSRRDEGAGRNARRARALRRSEAWRPWRAYAVMHLWRNS